MPFEGGTPPRPTPESWGRMRPTLQRWNSASPDPEGRTRLSFADGVGRNWPIRRPEQLGRYGLKVDYEDKEGVSPREHDDQLQYESYL